AGDPPGRGLAVGTSSGGGPARPAAGASRGGEGRAQGDRRRGSGWRAPRRNLKRRPARGRTGAPRARPRAASARQPPPAEGGRRGQGGGDGARDVPEASPDGGLIPDRRDIEWGGSWIAIRGAPACRVAPDRWLSVTVTSASARSVGEAEGDSPSALGSGDV